MGNGIAGDGSLSDVGSSVGHQIVNDLSSVKADLRVDRMNPDTGRSAWGLCVCKVVTINYEDMFVTLRTVVGTSQEFQRIPVPMTFPGVGARHFFGAMPQEGDFCVCGWMAQDSEGAGGSAGTKIPVILSWIPHGVQMGQGWMVTQPFTSDEYNFGDPRDAAAVRGAFHQQRHKIRHLQPGNIVCSSAQGSDLILDEGVYLTNRRANEIRLRDQDQALVVRSLQQFHAMAGVRIYGGMAQRDATLLQPAMVSDGHYYEGGKLLEEGEPAGSGIWGEFPVRQITPSRILRQEVLPNGELTGTTEFDVPNNLDPYVLLSRGLIIDKNGRVLISSSGVESDDSAYYGGKAYYRVASKPSQFLIGNAAIGKTPAFSEYRIEVAHTSDGTLPVTEQTEGFDIDRLPKTPNPQTSSGVSSQVPVVEVVYGTVIGNDPFSSEGKKTYGLPLTASVFSSNGAVNPTISSALGLGVEKQLASLFRLQPMQALNTQGAWWGLRKDGVLVGSLKSIEASLSQGAKISTGAPISFEGGGISVISKAGGAADGSNTGININSETGGVNIFAGGTLGGASKAVGNMMSSEGGGDSPSVRVTGSVISLEGGKQVQAIAQDRIRLNTPKDLNLEGGGVVEIKGGSRMVLSADEIVFNTNGKIVHQQGGPKNSLVTNGPSREQSIQCTMPGVQDSYELPLLGSQEKKATLGDFICSVKAGNITHETIAGVVKLVSAANKVEVGGGSIDVVAALGPVSLQAIAGGVTVNGMTGVDIQTTGRVQIAATAGISLYAPCAKMGAVVTQSDIHPIIGQPLGSPLCGLMGATGVRVNS